MHTFMNVELLKGGRAYATFFNKQNWFFDLVLMFAVCTPYENF